MSAPDGEGRASSPSPFGVVASPSALGRFVWRSFQGGLPRTHGFIYTKLTPSGRILAAFTIFVGASATGEGIHRPIYYLAIFLSLAMTIDAALAWLRKPRLRVERTLPDRCAAGATMVGRAQVVNEGRRSAFDVSAGESRTPYGTDNEPSECLARLDPGEAAVLEYTVRTRKRGAFDLRGPAVMTAGPLGLCQGVRKAAAPHRILVYPAFEPVGAVDLPVGSRHQPGGLQLVSRVGESEEFIGNREYRPGDRLRDLDQLAWARVGKPIVREFQQEYLSRVALVVDSHVPRRDAARADAFEAGISLGAAVADALSRLEYVIDIFAVGPDLYHLQAGRSLAYLDSILDILACIEPCRRSPFGTLGPVMQEEVGKISTAVVVLLDWDETRRRFVESLREVGVAVKVIVVRDRAPSLDPTGFTADAGPIKTLTAAQARGGMERL